jgi:threonine/homoserine/homoserine lactone efflux protein
MIFIGFLIGFLGYLPPGNINLTVVQLSIGQSRWQLFYFLLFASLMEFIYCFGSMAGMRYLMMQTALVLVMQWASVAMFTLLAILSFTARKKAPGTRPSGVKRGIVIAIFNPLQIPFWLVWGVYVLNNHWVQPGYLSIVLFSLITASGAFSILWLYAVAGKKLETILAANQRAMNVTIGCIFILLALLQLPKLLHLKSLF